MARRDAKFDAFDAPPRPHGWRASLGGGVPLGGRRRRGASRLFAGASLSAYDQVERAPYARAARCRGRRSCSTSRARWRARSSTARRALARRGAAAAADDARARARDRADACGGARRHRAGPFFLASAEAALAVPNVVDETYTGAINLTATLSFYPPPPPPPADVAGVAHLRRRAVVAGASSDGRRRAPRCRCGAATAPPAPAAAAAGGANLTRYVALPRRDYTSATVEVHATPHGECEEFCTRRNPTSSAAAAPSTTAAPPSAAAGRTASSSCVSMAWWRVRSCRFPSCTPAASARRSGARSPRRTRSRCRRTPLTSRRSSACSTTASRTRSRSASPRVAGTAPTGTSTRRSSRGRTARAARTEGGCSRTAMDPPSRRAAPTAAGEARGAAAGADALRFAVAATYGYEVVGEPTLPAAKTGRLVRAVATARGRLRGNVDNWLWGAAGDTAGTLSWWRESSLSVGDGARVRASRGGATPPARRRSDSPRPTAATPTPT